LETRYDGPSEAVVMIFIDGLEGFLYAVVHVMKKPRLTRMRQMNRRAERRGVATLDYVLVLCVVFPMAALLLWIGPRTMLLVYEMIAVMVSWPFM